MAKKVRRRISANQNIIDIQDAHIHQLSHRVADLEIEVKSAKDDAAMAWRECDKLNDELVGVQGSLQLVTEQVERMEDAALRMKGWQDCARELLVPLMASKGVD